MEWLTNSGDYRFPKMVGRVPQLGDEEPIEAWQRWNEWVAGKVIGPPKATEAHTVKELQDMGIIGIYRKE